MATLRDYFDRDFAHTLTVRQEHTLRSAEPSFEARVLARVHLDFDANAKFLSYYVPASPHVIETCRALLSNPQWGLGVSDGVLVQAGFRGETLAGSSELRFTGRVFFYLEDNLAEEKEAELKALAQSTGLLLRIRSLAFVRERSSLEKPLAFILHDSRNKEEIASPLAIQLSRMLCPVWFDEFSLKVGDSLRESIERGIRECRKCILVLTPEFLTNEGWARREFDSVYMREILEKERVVLPVWHGVSARDIYKYSPSLADRIGIDWSLGEDEVARRLHRAIMQAEE